MQKCVCKFLHRLLMAFLWLHQNNALRLQHNVACFVFIGISVGRGLWFSQVLMELKSIASKWKNNIILISLVIAVLYNRREVLLVVPLLLNEKIASVLWMIFWPRGQQRSRVVRDKFETDVGFFPYFGLNWTLVFRMYGSVQLWELCIIMSSHIYSRCFEGVNICSLREILQFH